MPKVVKIRKILSTLKALGFEEIRQKGDHLFLKHPDGRTTTLPLHPEIRIKLLTKIIKKDIKMETKNFLKKMKK